MKRDYSLPFTERYADKIMAIPFSGCHIWMGSDNGKYGQQQYHGRITFAHRIAFTEKNGDLAQGHEVCHRCDVPLCVNVDHLFSGTRSDNVQDMLSKRRDNKTSRIRGIAHHGAKLTENDVRAIRASGATQKSLAEQYGVRQSSIWAIKNKLTWRHLK